MHSGPLVIFSDDDIKVGRLLGSGSFSSVYILKQRTQVADRSPLLLQSCDDDDDDDDYDNHRVNHCSKYSTATNDYSDILTKTTTTTTTTTISIDDCDNDDTLSEQSHDICCAAVDESSEYVIKCPHPCSLSNEVWSALSTKNLLNEAYILMSLPPHRNIIRLYGMSSNLLSMTAANPFLVLERVTLTLDHALQQWNPSSWLISPESESSLNCSNHSEPVAVSMQCRLRCIGLEIAQGMQFLHEHNVLHRDLKPSNVGLVQYCRGRGMIRILDFGSAKRFPSSPSSNESRLLTKEVGTIRYMAPEVYESSCNDNYGFPADVYSFTMMLWELLTLNKAFDHYEHDKKDELKYSIQNEGKRPPVDDAIPPIIKRLIQAGWHPDQHARPTFTEIVHQLETAIESLRWQSSKMWELYFI